MTHGWLLEVKIEITFQERFQAKRRPQGTTKWKLSKCTVGKHKNLYSYFNKLSTKPNSWRKKIAKNGEKQFVQYPGLIAQYTENMGSVDQNDQLWQYYSIRAHQRKCYVYIYYFSIDVAITNAYIFHCLLCEPSFHNMKYFHLNLATQLILYNSQKCTVFPSILPETFFGQSHFLQKQNDKHYWSHYSYTYKKIRKYTQWCCQDCNIHLCHTGKSNDCFLLYHTKYL